MNFIRPSIFRRWTVAELVGLVSVSFALIAFNSVEVTAFSTPPSTAQLTRFDELRAVEVLICNIRMSSVKYEGLDRNDPQISIIQNTDEKTRPFGDIGIMFDREKTKATFFAANPPTEDLDIAGLQPLASTASLLPVRGRGFLTSSTNGAIVVPNIIFELDFTGAFGDLRILADPAFEGIFPVIGGSFAGVENAWLIAGQCKPDIPDATSWPRIAWLSDANCGHTSAQESVAIDHLLRSKRGDGDLVEAYKWLQIYLGKVDEDSLGYYSASIERDIAASWMTPEQITDAERLAAEWVADPSRCEDSRLINPTE